MKRLEKVVVRLILLAGLALAGATVQPAEPARAEGAATMSKQQRMRKLQILNRVFQVGFGRSITRAEARKLVNLNNTAIIKWILENQEFRRIYGERLVEFSKDPTSGTLVGSAVDTNASPNPTKKLAQVLKNLGGKRHGGSFCDKDENVACFAKWIIGRTAPALGEGWVDARRDAIQNMSYARLLEQVSMSSLALQGGSGQ